MGADPHRTRTRRATPGAGGAAARGGALDLPADRAAAELAPSYAALVARVADLEDRLAAALERRAPAGAEWSAPYPPPPPPVEVAPPARLVARSSDDRRDPQLGPGRPSATPAAPASTSTSWPTG